MAVVCGGLRATAPTACAGVALELVPGAGYYIEPRPLAHRDVPLCLPHLVRARGRPREPVCLTHVTGSCLSSPSLPLVFYAFCSLTKRSSIARIRVTLAHAARRALGDVHCTPARITARGLLFRYCQSCTSASQRTPMAALASKQGPQPTTAHAPAGPSPPDAGDDIPYEVVPMLQKLTSRGYGTALQ